uniref:syntaxin-8-like n=1 Tax=Ciona intestinalis TaxID=7719 RepID=UPI000180BF79|nr:syntaxin-8-like [Ciona intestinalis]|eukprot:XP_026692883.1 syntaxin-8-like [Ciona intestinalis]
MWQADYSSCQQLCQDVAESINDRNKEIRLGGSVSKVNCLIKKDLLNLKSMTEKLRLDLIRSAKSHTTTHGEVERRQNLLDTLSTKVRILDKAAERSLSTSSAAESPLRANKFHLLMHSSLSTDQDAGLDVLSETLSRQKNIGINIGKEADYQNELIDDIHGRIEETDSRIKQQTTSVLKISRKSSSCILWMIIILLAIAIIALIAVGPQKH